MVVSDPGQPIGGMKHFSNIRGKLSFLVRKPSKIVLRK
jgi:hypothetical protein